MKQMFDKEELLIFMNWKFKIIINYGKLLEA